MKIDPPRTYDFDERLAWSDGVAETDVELLAILRSRIPGCIRVTRATTDDDRNEGLPL